MQTKFDKEYNKLLNIILEADDATGDNQSIQSQTSGTVSNKSSSTWDNISKYILPTILGLGSISMLFGKGIFGLGGRNEKTGKTGIFGGWIGQTIGSIIGVSLLPGLWSNKDFGTRISDAFSKFSNGEIWDGLKELAGFSSSADKVIEDGKTKLSKLESSEDKIKERRDSYTKNASDNQKIIKFLRSNKYDISNDLLQLTEKIAITPIVPLNKAEEEKIGGAKSAICLLLHSDKGTQATMCSITQIRSYINLDYVTSLNISFTAKKDVPIDPETK